MNSQILTKINIIIKNRLIELLGITFLIFSFFLFLSIITYSPEDPNFIYDLENTEIKNLGGFYGSIISDFLLQSLGLVSFLLTVNFFYWGIKLITKKKINNFITKIFYILAYITFGSVILNILYNHSFWLFNNGNGGFVGSIITQNIYHFTPLIEHQYVIYIFTLLTIIFFILSLGIKTSEVKIIFLLNVKFIKKVLSLFKKNTNNEEVLDIELGKTKNEIRVSKDEQPILPFSNKQEPKTKNAIFKLPTINFLEKNPRSKK